MIVLKFWFQNAKSSWVLLSGFGPFTAQECKQTYSYYGYLSFACHEP